MLPIVYKFVMDNNGLLRGVELWQGDNHITVSMSAEGTHRNGYRWIEVRDFLDKEITLPQHIDAELLTVEQDETT